MADDIVNHILRSVQIQLEAQGVTRQQSGAILAEVDAETRAIYGHERVYIPARGSVRSARDLAICSEYASGHCIQRLQQRYDMSERQVRRILAANPVLSHYHQR